MPKDELLMEVKKLISMGKEKGYLTYEEVNSKLPAEMVSSEQLGNLMTMFGEMDIEILDASEGDRYQKVARPGEVVREAEEAEVLDDGEKEIDLTPGVLSRTDDPVRLYLKEMGSVALLSREGEIEIAKRIEEGKNDIAGAVYGLPMTVEFVLSLRDKLKTGKISVRELVPVSEEEFAEEPEEQDDTELRQRTLDALSAVRKPSRVLNGLYKKSRAASGDLAKHRRIKQQIDDARHQVVEKVESVSFHATLKDRMVQRVRDLAQEIRLAEREVSHCQRKLGVPGAQGQELLRRLDSGQPLGRFRRAAQLRDVPQHGQILVGYLEGRRDDQEEVVHRVVVDRLEIDPRRFPAEGDAEPADDQRPSVRDRDPPADACRSEVLPPFQHLEQDAL